MKPTQVVTSAGQVARKFYSQRAIAIATYFGGPLAAGVLVRQNFINLGKEEHGKYALLIGILSSVLLFAGLFSVPEEIMEKIPNAVIPAVYTGIIYLVVEMMLGPVLKAHKDNNGEFYSAWKATGVGAVCTVILLAGIFAYVYLAPAGFDVTRYDNGLAEFQKNEEQALSLFTLLESEKPRDVEVFIRNKGIPAWEKNIRLLDEMDGIEGLNQELKNQNAILREYCQLRIKSFQLIEKGLDEGSDEYLQQVEVIHKQIDELLTKI